MNNRTARSEKWGYSGLTKQEIHENKRRALVQVASKIFREKGFDQTSMDDVAKTLNISKTAVYYYVKNKRELLYLCHLLAFAYGEVAIEKAENEGKNGREKLELLLRNYIISLTEELGGGNLMAFEDMLEPEQFQDIKKRRKSWDKAFRAIIQGGIEDGNFRDCDPRMIEFFVMGAVRNIHQWYSPEGESSGEEIANALIQMVFDGILSEHK